MKMLTVLAAFALATPAIADSLEIEEAYIRVSGPTARAAAGFMVIHNTGDREDRLISVASEAARKVELHTHLIDDAGVARMREVKGGFIIPAGGAYALERGADHVMMMGLTAPLADGDQVEMVLTFEVQGEITVTLPVDNQRKPGGHGAHGH